MPFKKPQKFIVNGLYKYSRNPIYLGMVILLFGIATSFGSLSSYIVIPIFILIIKRNFIEIEEKMLLKEFGYKYKDYCRTVRRWI